MTEHHEKISELGDLLRSILSDNPEGFPKNELGNELIGRGHRISAKDLGVKKLSLVFKNFSFIEEIEKEGKVFLRLKRKSGKGNSSKADVRDRNIEERHSPAMAGRKRGNDSRSVPGGLLGQDLLGPALWQAPGASSNPVGRHELRAESAVHETDHRHHSSRRSRDTSMSYSEQTHDARERHRSSNSRERQNSGQNRERKGSGQDASRRDVFDSSWWPTPQQSRQQQQSYGPSFGQSPTPPPSVRQQRGTFVPLQTFFSQHMPPPSHLQHQAPPPSPQQPRSHFSKEHVESVAQVCIDQLSEAAEYVSVERIEKLLLQILKVRSVREMGIHRINAVDHIETVRQHLRLACKVNAYIQTFVQVRSICTLHELEINMREFSEDKTSFDSLKLGPLQKQPMVYDMFKFPPTAEEIPEIGTLDILKHLREYLTSENKWTERCEMEPLMDYLVKQYDVPDAFHLGVRIRSLPLAVQMLKKAQRDAAGSRKSVFDSLMAQVKLDVEGAVQRFRASVLEPTASSSDGGTLEIRRHYLEVAPEVVIMEIFSKFQLLVSLERSENKAARKRQTRMMTAISDFLTTVRDDQIASRLFHLAICVGALEMQELLKGIMGGEVASSEDTAETTTTQIKPPPPIDKLVEKLQAYLERCLMHGTVSLEHMQKVEENLLKDFDFPSFQAMGFNSFLWFLLNQREAKTLLEENCGLCLGSPGAQGASAGYRATYTEVLQLVRQADAAGVTESDSLEAILCSQFGVREVRHLGYGMIDRLKKAAMKSGKHQSKEGRLVYEAALCPSSRLWGSRQVGILGSQSRDSARACLHNCPLLASLGDWSNWHLVFEPQFGPLKEFVQKYGGLQHFQAESGTMMVTTDFVAMETQPGQLIKLVSQTSVEKFADAVKRGDVTGTCSHLLSQIVLNKGLTKAPLALLTNHVKAALFSLNAQSVDQKTPGGPPQKPANENRAVNFVLRCLIKLPIRMCVALAVQVFLKPLGEVVGSHQSKMLLLQLATTDSVAMSRLLELGCLLGVGEWSKQAETRWQFPSDAVVITVATGGDQGEGDESWMEVGEDKSEIIEEDSESDSDSSDFLEDSDSDDSAEEDGEEEEKMEEPSTTTGADGEGTSMEDEDKEVSSSAEEEQSGGISEEAETDQTPDDVCRAIVEQIRRKEFGIGIELSDEGQELMQIQQERLGRSLDRLSRDLYNKDTHFVLELVQNADDNAYPSDTDSTSEFCPTIEFVVESDRVVVNNNECGFKEANIRALCDVGRSTKGKHTYGYIGQKGIGFKSVFRVTDAPEVHSNDFHIRFDVSSGPTGYILPHWVETEPSTSDKWMTQIVLPYKDGLQKQTLAARFNDIQPSLLLFLHRLRQITIVNKVEGGTVSMRRRDLGDSIVEINHTDTTDRWLVVRKILDASQISLQAKSGVEVESTEIALAFPLRQADQRSLSQVLPPKQEVFAFLPLHSYGFRFIIQGDFDVPSSREDVDKDSAWNQWLRNEIPALFIQAFEAFKAHKDFNLMEAICSYLQLVPIEDEILDFFQPVASHILQRLRGKNIIPTHPNSKDQVFMKKPSQVISTRDSLVKEVVNADLLQKHLNLYYLHDDLAAMLNPSLTTTLGIETVTTQHLLQIGRAMAVSLPSSAGAEFDESIEVVSKWLACVYRSMDEIHPAAEVLSALRGMEILPLSGGEYTSLDKRTVFFPIAKLSNKKRKTDPFLVLQSDLFALHPGLVNTSDTVVNPQVDRLLGLMGVKALSPAEVIAHHIMPVLTSPAWKEKSIDLMVSYILYIKQETDLNPNLVKWEELRAVAQILTNQGLRNPATHPVHFTPSYGNKLQLPQDLPGYDWVLVDSVYLNGCTQPSDCQRWRQFLTKLGVEDFLVIRNEVVQLTSENITSSPWAAVKDMWRPQPTGYVVNDCSCEELRKLISENSHESTFPQQMKVLCEILDRDWDGVYSRYQNVPVSDASRNTQFDTMSSFCLLLQTSAWLPGIKSKPLVNDPNNIRLEQKIVMSKPSELYVRDPEIEKLLTYTVPYVGANLSPQSSFTGFLQLRNSVDAKIVQALFGEWSAREKDCEPTKFCTSLNHMKSLYQFLFDRLSMKEAQDFMRDKAIIFVPESVLTEDFDPGALVAGVMLKREEVWWCDPTGLFTRRRASLKEFHAEVAKKRILVDIYPDMEQYFTGRFGHIQAQPSLVEYAQLWLHITSTEILGRENHALRDVLTLMAQIGHSLMEAGNSSDPVRTLTIAQDKKKLLQLLKTQKTFPTKGDVWVSLTQHPMLADNLALERLFQEKDDVYFLQLEEKQTPLQKRRKHKRHMAADLQRQEAISVLLDVCNIPTLSSSVTAMDVTELSRPCPELQMFMHKVVPYIQRYLYTHYCDEAYQSHIMENMAEKLLTMRFRQVKTLEVVYSLRHSPDTVVQQNESCMYDYTNNAFLFQQDHVKDYPDINREIAKCFSKGDGQCLKDLRGFLAELTPIFQMHGNVEELLERHEIMTLPDEEVKWAVPQPVIQTAPEPVKKEPPAVEGETGRYFEAADSSTLRAWPPNSSVAPQEPLHLTAKASEERPKSNVWPPPKPPEYMDTKELPPRFRLPTDGQGEGGSRPSEGQVTQRTPSDGSGDSVRKDGHREGTAQLSSRAPTGQPHRDGPGTSSQSAREAIPAVPPGDGMAKGEVAGAAPKENAESSVPTPMVPGTPQNPLASAGRGIARSPQSADTREISPSGRKRFPPQEIASPSPKKPSLQLCLPIWDENTMSSTLYEELAVGASLPFPEDIELSEDGQIKDIGDWGERLVRDYLRRLQEDDSSIRYVIWSKETGNEANPYDFEVISQTAAGEQSIFIEVKATLSAQKETFAISAQELRFAFDKRDKFYIFRIYGAGSRDNVRLVRIRNVAFHLDKKNLRLCLVV